MLDLWSLYITKESDKLKQEEVARILDIPAEEAQSLRRYVESGEFKLGEEEVERDIF